MTKKSVAVTMCFCLLVLLTGTLHGQKDPGPRVGPPGAGSFYSTLNDQEQGFFSQASMRFLEVDSVSGSIPGEAGVGLGPTFNGNSCAQCHAQPAVGGSSPGLSSPQNPIPNPQVALAALDQAGPSLQVVPSFITPNGPVREARFVRNPNGTPDGGVHALFTISGRTDATGCTIAQPNFNQALANNNVIFRIPTPTFGLGLVEMTPDVTLRANLVATASQKFRLGIGGAFNTSGNDGTITRFGWKAQNKSLLIFAGEAYNVEQGVSNELFPNERSTVSGCVYNGSPEDYTNILSESGSLTGSASDMSSDVVNFANFMMLSAPPTPAAPTDSTTNGSNLFSQIGCALCHSPSLTTGPSRFTGMSNVTYSPYSDFAIHHMGSGLADGISQGAAGPDQFRTAPLWGVGQRLFFLHDGRTSDLLVAIQSHADCGGRNRGQGQGFGFRAGGCDSEANGVIRNFNNLTSSQQQDILTFLRSL
jgi:CxxC motif-containing protein (DUF1111 family)